MQPTAGPIPVADGHSDLLQELVFAEDEGEENPLLWRWLDQLRAGGVSLQVCAVFRNPGAEGDGTRELLRQTLSFHEAVARNPEVFAVRDRRDLEEVAADRVGLMLGIEGVAAVVTPGNLLCHTRASTGTTSRTPDGATTHWRSTWPVAPICRRSPRPG